MHSLDTRWARSERRRSDRSEAPTACVLSGGGVDSAGLPDDDGGSPWDNRREERSVRSRSSRSSCGCAGWREAADGAGGRAPRRSCQCRQSREVCRLSPSEARVPARRILERPDIASVDRATRSPRRSVDASAYLASLVSLRRDAVAAAQSSAACRSARFPLRRVWPGVASLSSHPEPLEVALPALPVKLRD